MNSSKVLILPHNLEGNFQKWNDVHFCYTASCYCTAIRTDMESYIEVEAMEEDCLNVLCGNLIELGFILSEETIVRSTVRRRD
jgi:hypothetical protein